MPFYGVFSASRAASSSVDGERCATQGKAEGPERGGGALGSYGRRRGRAQSTEQRAMGSEARAKTVALLSLCQPRLRSQPRTTMDTLPEWSKGVDSSSTSASCVGSNPTGVIFTFARQWRLQLTRQALPTHSAAVRLALVARAACRRKRLELLLAAWADDGLRMPSRRHLTAAAYLPQQRSPRARKPPDPQLRLLRLHANRATRRRSAQFTRAAAEKKTS